MLSPGLSMAFFSKHVIPETRMTRPRDLLLTLKIQGYLTKLKSYRFYCKVTFYLDVLEASCPASSVFEGNDLMPYEISEAIEKTNLELEEIKRVAGTDDDISSHVTKFSVQDDDTVVGNYLHGGDGRKKIGNRENVVIPITDMKYSNEVLGQVAAMKSAVASELKRILNERFPESESALYQAFKIYDPFNWDNEDPTYGEEELKLIVQHFKVPLSATTFEERKVFIEWRSIKTS